MTRAWRIVCSTIVVALIGINLIFFINEADFYPSSFWGQIKILRPLSNNDEFHYRGISYFAEILESFPALANCQTVMANVSRILSGYYTSANSDILSVLNSILYVLVTPLNILIAFVYDIISNLLWVFGVLLPNVFYS